MIIELIQNKPNRMIIVTKLFIELIVEFFVVFMRECITLTEFQPDFVLQTRSLERI